ncbi:MAG: hypothetical protein KJZ93_19200, partial [Caldilineaceae bacterium]|nr:hypothetical protein [Caldilineaceae bacterium]
RAALRANLAVADCFATDHAPHTVAEKDSPQAPPGFPGLETALPLYLALVDEGLLTLEELVEKIQYYRELLADRGKRLGVVRDETREVADAFGDDRKTQIRAKEAQDLRVEDLIAEEDMVITITQDGYAKRLPIDTYRVQRRGGRGLLALTKKEEDAVEHIFVATTHDYILFFTNRGRVHQLRAFEIPQAGRTSRGIPVINLINIEPGEFVTGTLPIPGLDVEGYLTMVTREGTVKKTAIVEFSNINRMGLNAITLVDDDELWFVRR